MMTKNTFSKPVQHNGIIFDSILECKFALQIEDACDYYYHPLTIWYDKKDKSKFGKQTCNDQYQPDFIVRKRNDNTCYLIEVKSSKDRYHEDTLLKEFHAKRHIERMGHNWKYVILTEREIVVPIAKRNALAKAKNTRVSVASKKRLNKKHTRHSGHSLNLRSTKMPIQRNFDYLSEEDYRHYIKTGEIRNT